jgi:hypothetical protein
MRFYALNLPYTRVDTSTSGAEVSYSSFRWCRIRRFGLSGAFHVWYGRINADFQPRCGEYMMPKKSAGGEDT